MCSFLNLKIKMHFFMCMDFNKVSFDHSVLYMWLLLNLILFNMMTYDLKDRFDFHPTKKKK